MVRSTAYTILAITAVTAGAVILACEAVLRWDWR